MWFQVSWKPHAAFPCFQFRKQSLLFQNKEIPEGHRHYFAIYHVKSPEGKTVKEIWTKTVKPDGALAHFIFFAN